jgi:Holliday junction resolvase-like predicted endonuclease
LADYGEIDLDEDEHALVFVEVELRRGTEFGDPLEAVVPGKQTRLRLMVEQYLAEREDDFVAGFDEMRFDVVGILATGARRPSIRHVENAF